MPGRGLEPPRDCSHTLLKRTRLPIPPPGHIGFCITTIVSHRMYGTISTMKSGTLFSHIIDTVSGAFSSEDRSDGGGISEQMADADNDPHERAMLEVQQMIDTRTQSLAQKICANC